MGHLRFVGFYLLCGLAAAGLQIATNPESAVPMVGASGAIGGVMGGYVLLYPRVHVHMLVFIGFYITRIAVPAALMLGYWFLLQFFGGLGTLGAQGGGAFWAHIGGVAAGAILGRPLPQPPAVGAASLLRLATTEVPNAKLAKNFQVAGLKVRPWKLHPIPEVAKATV